jgi:hypothetical protein
MKLSAKTVLKLIQSGVLECPEVIFDDSKYELSYIEKSESGFNLNLLDIDTNIIYTKSIPDNSCLTLGEDTPISNYLDIIIDRFCDDLHCLDIVDNNGELIKSARYFYDTDALLVRYEDESVNESIIKRDELATWLSKCRFLDDMEY